MYLFYHSHCRFGGFSLLFTVPGGCHSWYVVFSHLLCNLGCDRIFSKFCRNHLPQGDVSPKWLCVCFCKASQGHSYTHFSKYHPWLLLCCQARAEQLQEIVWPANPKIFPTSFTEKVCRPLGWRLGWSQERNESALCNPMNCSTPGFLVLH